MNRLLCFAVDASYGPIDLPRHVAVGAVRENLRTMMMKSDRSSFEIQSYCPVDHELVSVEPMLLSVLREQIVDRAPVVLRGDCDNLLLCGAELAHAEEAGDVANAPADGARCRDVRTSHGIDSSILSWATIQILVFG